MAFKSRLSEKRVQGLPGDVMQRCKHNLLQLKAENLNRSFQAAQQFNQIDKATGDEIDQSSAHQEEHTFLINQSRLKSQLLEIEFALSRIEQGTYGVCEETEELIEEERLMALPYTRCSIEGAEMRESLIRKFAR